MAETGVRFSVWLLGVQMRRMILRYVSLCYRRIDLLHMAHGRRSDGNLDWMMEPTLRIGVTAARQALNLLVGVRIPHPQLS